MMRARRYVAEVCLGCLAAFAVLACTAHVPSVVVDAGTPPPGSSASRHSCASDDTGAPRICDFAHIALRVSDLAKARGFYGGSPRPPQALRVPRRAVLQHRAAQLIHVLPEASPVPRAIILR